MNDMQFRAKWSTELYSMQEIIQKEVRDAGDGRIDNVYYAIEKIASLVGTLFNHLSPAQQEAIARDLGYHREEPYE